MNTLLEAETETATGFIAIAVLVASTLLVETAT